MNDTLWASVDDYICSQLVPEDAALAAALEASAAAGLPSIQVSPNQGKFLHLLARSIGAQRILEIGTLGGYSTIWLARALPAGGTVVTLEADARHADVAKTNFRRAGLEGAIELRLGAALDTLPTLKGQAPFDFIFIDADKANIPAYFDHAVALSRPGGLIVVDNVVRKGGVIDAASADPDIQGVRRFNEQAAADKRVSATAVQTVGSKGYDGFALALVLGAP